MIKTLKRFSKLARCSTLVITDALPMEVVHIVEDEEFRDSSSVKAFALSFL